MYRSFDKNIWTGRIDDEDGDYGKRWFQMINPIDLTKEELPSLSYDQKAVVLLGYCCDEGVKRNKGRTGAANGPDTIRKACSNFVWHHNENKIKIYDAGNVVCEDSDMEGAQTELAELIAKTMRKNYLPILLGGGHDIAYAGFRGAANVKKNIGVINFDAHFDLRDYSTRGNSGTPFMQIADLCKSQNTEFHYMCLGIQPQSNAQSLFNRAEELKVNYIYARDLNEENSPVIFKAIRAFAEAPDYLYLTIDLDVFDLTDSPGVSAPTTAGPDKKLVNQYITSIFQTGKVIACDFAEMNPKYDIDNRTARLTAWLIYEMIFSYVDRDVEI